MEAKAMMGSVLGQRSFKRGNGRADDISAGASLGGFVPAGGFRRCATPAAAYRRVDELVVGGRRLVICGICKRT